MAYLAENDFEVWALPQLLESLRNGEPMPEKVVAITFDDGYESVYSEALPVLQKHDFPFTVFVNTALVGGAGYMSWDVLRELADEGVTIANHTVSHPHLVRRLEDESQEQWQVRIKREMSKPEAVLRSKLGHSPKLLAYPYGEYNRQVQALAKELGLIAFAQHSGAFDENADWQAMPRFAFGGAYTAMAGFIDKVNSLPMPLKAVRVIDEQGQQLADPLLPMAVSRPVLTLRLNSPELAQQVSCFASGQGRIEVQVKGDTVSTRPEQALPVGRSRINCTAASGQRGRFYWHSEFFMRKRPDGSWYPEP
ncbi:MAG: polysaccharide deacetylase family protein [Gammaproteobacteria bacterium]|nr:polysaccharide deacetylase family protein [Gammaproteobacteria bacterium]